jgi:hypothetical protein
MEPYAVIWNFVNHWKFTIGYVLLCVGVIVSLRVG